MEHIYDADEMEIIVDCIRKNVFRINREGGLDELLNNMGITNPIQTEQPFPTFKEGKIVVLGSSMVKEKDMLAIAGDLGLDTDRFEFFLDYNRLPNHNYKKYQSPNYRVILLGPISHSTRDKGDSSSIIEEISNNKQYPRSIKLEANNKMKITKTNFRSALEALIKEDYI